jgi:hypothetical protein
MLEPVTSQRINEVATPSMWLPSKWMFVLSLIHSRSSLSKTT